MHIGNTISICTAKILSASLMNINYSFKFDCIHWQENLIVVLSRTNQKRSTRNNLEAFAYHTYPIRRFQAERYSLFHCLPYHRQRNAVAACFEYRGITFSHMPNNSVVISISLYNPNKLIPSQKQRTLARWTRD